MLNDTNDQVISKNPPALSVGRKWNVWSMVQEVEAIARQREIVGVVREKGVGIGMVKRQPILSEAGLMERRKIREQEVRNLVDSERMSKAAQ